MSQLDLAIAADVSARHVSFLETGRAQPSDEMVRRLSFALNVPLRDQSAMLRAAGFPDAFSERAADPSFPPIVEQAITRMLAQHEPFPMCVMNKRYDVLRLNSGAQRLLSRFIADPQALAPRAGEGSAPPLNVARALFDPRLVRPFVVNWTHVARDMLSRLHREALEHDSDAALAGLLRSLLEYPDIPREWLTPDFSTASEPCLTLRLRDGDKELAFLVTVTVFSAPQQVSLDELRIESYFPLDDVTVMASSA